MERKFTDDEIVKAIEICTKAKCWGDCEDMGCPASTKQGCVFYLRTDEDYEGVIQMEMLKDALDLINRQKAEIERLNGIRADLSKEIEGLRTAAEEAVGCYNRMESLYHIKCMELKVSKSEAIKAFAERLKQHCAPGGDFGDPCGVLTATDRWIDQLVQEMTGENNGN